MRRLFEADAYKPQPGNYWATTRPKSDWPTLENDGQTEVAIIGGGFTGLNAALALAEHGVAATVLEAETPGFGASGRNGGFCCQGGALLESEALRKRFGAEEADLWAQAENAAIDHVAGLLETHGINADTHSNGEICLAHSKSAARRMAKKPGFIPPVALKEQGLGGPWLGGSRTPKGFALNPQKYHDGLARAAFGAGAKLFARSPVTALSQSGGKWRLQTPHGTITADKVILATNGYSSEDIPSWLRSRTMPVQSSVIVTRPIKAEEQDAAGWTSDMMAYDSRALLHYFRLMPNGRFLFGMRGGLRATPRAQRAISRKIRKDFRALFPAWRDIEIEYEWSGLVCLMASLVPFIGPVPEQSGLFAALGYHGNGVAFGSFAGRLIAHQLMDKDPKTPAPMFLRTPPGRFPFGMHRRHLLRPAYLAADLLDL
ncbi:NAD(P)/FAD-dependent oxidoreductase [Pacificoceanicola onchidii]|uniref:NAD(P)/FAD-dependent oxidoreductase n=1 Tax=Pacificoceanicola onchidii TaxID=2562685 RepID=UPI0010A58B3D|nr:FAD-binding oxidoreductase [Pacificoceanicola onchidii]